jgi:hypothetical protein
MSKKLEAVTLSKRAKVNLIFEFTISTPLGLWSI